MTQRAEHMKAFTATFKNLYVTLSDEQKPLARLVLRAIGSGHHFAGSLDGKSAHPE
jgi:hypothetical protein